MAPYTGKAKSYHTIQFPYATSSRSSLVQGTALKKITYKQSNYIKNMAFNHFPQKQQSEWSLTSH